VNPLTDKVEIFRRPDGSTLEVIRPGAATRNYRLTKEAFTRYETILTDAINRWPEETAWEIPTNLSPNTFVAQLREARRALLLFNYNPDLKTRLMAIDHEVALTLDPRGTSVWFRKRAQNGRPMKFTPLASAGRAMNLSTSTVRNMPTADQLDALCKLISQKVIDGPILLRGRVSPELISQLEISYDIAFAYDAPTDVTTVL
jgi:hypothetical protein